MLVLDPYGGLCNFLLAGPFMTLKLEESTCSDLGDIPPLRICLHCFSSTKHIRLGSVFFCLVLILKSKHQHILGALNQCLTVSKFSVCVDGRMGGWVGKWAEGQAVRWMDGWTGG